MADLPELDPRIHQPTRLKIMALVYRNRNVAFTWLRDELGLTDGNLASHAQRLMDEGLIGGGRTLTTKGFQVRYRITETGDVAFRSYVAALRRLVDETDDVAHVKA